MRAIKEIWKDYQFGNHIDDKELSYLLTIVSDAVRNLEWLGDTRYRLVVDDLIQEKNRLTQYNENRKDKYTTH
jgi:hypothetical protein